MVTSIYSMCNGIEAINIVTNWELLSERKINDLTDSTYKPTCLKFKPIERLHVGSSLVHKRVH